MHVEPVSPTAPALRGPVLLSQDWCDLSFLHWAVDPGRVAGLMPPGVRPDELDGATYVALVPFRMEGSGIARGPGVPYLGSFLETNVRLYSVDDRGRRGIVFLSLDTDRLAVVGGARAGFGLPYRWARMRHRSGDGTHDYQARLRWPGVRARSRVSVRVGDAREPTALDTFLTARWGLHTRWLGRTRYVPNRHETWRLRDLEPLRIDDQLMASVGLPELAGRPPDHTAFADGVHTEFGLARAGGTHG